MIVIRYANGTVRNGVLMALWGERLRIAAQGSDEVLEFRLMQDTWLSDAIEPVKFEFPTAVFESIGIFPSELDPHPAEPAKITLDENSVCATLSIQ